MCPSSTAAKKLLTAELNRLQLPFSCLTVRTVGLLDLPQQLCISVTIHGWQPNPAAWASVQHFARMQGFRVKRSLATTRSLDGMPEAARPVRAKVRLVTAVPAHASPAEQQVRVPALV
jgi:hypothetical protein